MDGCPSFHLGKSESQFRMRGEIAEIVEKYIEMRRGHLGRV